MPETTNREREIFEAALELTSAEARSGYLLGACGQDVEMRSRIEALLRADAEAGGFLPMESGKALLTKTISMPLAEEAGGRIGRYKLREKIGEGGCGAVYVAEQEEPVRRRVAIKVIKLGMDTKAVVARFEAERQALAMMDHPNIAKVLDAGTTESGRPYFVMELVRGIRITDYCDQANLGAVERIDLFIKVCQAIQHAHQKGVIHRDIKPSNILVTLHDGEPVPKVIDFGIAKATEGRLADATVYTQLHQFIGTPAYMSPEQAEMSGLDIDTRSDIYSLGVLLYELLVGSTPFDAKELVASGIDAMRKTIREKEPMRPSTRFATLQGDELTTVARRRAADTSKFLHQLEGDLDWIVMKCLEKDRTRRYETANGLAADLKRHLVSEPVVARPPSAAYKFQKAFHRNKIMFSAAAAVAAALVVGISVSAWQALAARRAERAEEVQRVAAQQKQTEAESERARAQAERARANSEAKLATESQQQARRLLYDADMTLAQQSLAQNNLGKARRLLDRHRPQPGEEDLRGWEWRYLWQATRSSALATLTNRPIRGFSLSFSPDGNQLAAGWYDGQVELWDVPGRRCLRTLTVGSGTNYPAHVAFSPTRHLLAATGEAGVVRLYDLDSGLDSVLWHGGSNRSDIRDLAFSEDGSKLVLYASSYEAGGDVMVADVSSARIEGHYPTLYVDTPHHGVARLSPDNQRLYLSVSHQRENHCGIQCVDVATKHEIWQTPQVADWGATALAVSPDGKVVASGSGFEDSAIRIWDAATGRLLIRLDGHTSWMGKLIFSKDGRRLISAAADQSIRFWDTSNWTEIRALHGHTDEVHGLAFSDATGLIASASKDGDLKLWKDDGTKAADGYLRLPEALSRGWTLALDHARFLFAPGTGPPFLVDFNNGAVPTSLAGISASRYIVAYAGTNILLRWNGSNEVRILELRGAEFIPGATVAIDSAKLPLMDYCPKRQMVAWAGGVSNASVYLEAVASPDRRIELKSGTKRLWNVAFSEDGNYLAATSDEAFRVWNVESGQLVASDDNAEVGDFNFAARGLVFVADLIRGNDHEIAFYSLDHPDQAPRRVPGKYESRGVAVSPGRDLVAASSYGGIVDLFDPAKGQLLESLHGHMNSAFGLAFSSDGKRLVSSSGAREAVKLWDVATRQELLTLPGTGSALQMAKWSSDDSVILAGSPWQAWRAPSWEEIAAAEAREKSEGKEGDRVAVQP